VARWTHVSTPITALALLLILACPIAAGAASYTPPASTRVAIALSGWWRFIRADCPGAELPAFDDSSWSMVTVPHTWNNIDGQDGPDVGGDPNGRGYYRGVGCYRRHVIVPPGYGGRRLYIQFDGSNLVTELWINGFHVGRHDGGFTAFRFDVTDVVDSAPGNYNVITVKVDNGNAIRIAPLSGDFTSFGGIYRDVSLIATDPLSLRIERRPSRKSLWKNASTCAEDPSSCASPKAAARRRWSTIWCAPVCPPIV
jgi:beta-galactosidase